ncbi:Glycosyltransferase [Marinovum algicola DG 898]|nr:Glycosyltransferase [Marinovum algicola DG 898]
MIPPEKIVLFYKRLVDPGGAERLLLKEFQALRQMGYDPYILCYAWSEDALFGLNVPHDRLVRVEGFAGLIRQLWRLGRPGILCASGHLDIGLASVLAGCKYALHIHHPSFMTFNETDKYSLFQRHHFERYTSSNFGAARFRRIGASHGLMQKLKINLRAAWSIWAIRRACCTFVLSDLARTEKRDLFGIEALTLYGALDREEANRLPTALARRRARPPRDRLTLFSLARLDENKRFDVLLRAVAGLAATGVNVALKVAGRGPEKNALMTLSDTLGISERVTFLGFVADADLPSLMDEADLFVSIDWADYKLTMYEALSYGLPVLVSTETECSATLAETGYVHVCTPEAEAVAQAVRELHRTPPDRDDRKLAEVLNSVTWPRYFRQIADSLHRHHVVRIAPSGAE